MLHLLCFTPEFFLMNKISIFLAVPAEAPFVASALEVSCILHLNSLEFRITFCYTVLHRWYPTGRHINFDDGHKMGFMFKGTVPHDFTPQFCLD